ncbi:MAG: hypothetical protein HPY54_03335 [Chthonomonadetes bacterium]|nr:hypothetical protein [Chthonomonadetes bacterium]
MKPFVVAMTALSLLLLVNWCEAQSLPRIRPVHPALLGAVKQVRLPADNLRPQTPLQGPTLMLYDATSLAQLAYDGAYWVLGPASGEVFREQIPLLGPARLDALQILYVAGGAAGSTVNASVTVYGCLSGYIGDDPVAGGFPVIATFTGTIPADGTYVLTLDMGGVVYNAGTDAQGRQYSHDLLVQLVFTGTNVPALFLANGANSLGLRNDGGGLEITALYPLGAGAFWNDVGNRLHMERYFIGTSDNVWRQGTGNYWFGGSPLGNFSISVQGSYNFVGQVSNNAGVDMTEAKLQIDGHPVTVPLELVGDGVRMFTLPLTPDVTHDVRVVMGPPYLVRAKSVMASSPAEPVVEDFFLVSGDLDGDNEVTLFDFGILVQSFGEIGD